MLKITTQISAGTMTVQLEGKLTSPWTEELDRYWREVIGFQHRQVMIDLTDVTFIDSDGKTLLTQLWQQGAQFYAAGCLNTSIVEEITANERADSSGRIPRR